MIVNTSPIPNNEMDRILSLYEFDIDYTNLESTFKDLTHLAAKLSGTNISLVNIDASKVQTVTIDLRGTKYSAVTGRILTSKKLQDYNSFDEPNKIQPTVFNGAKLSGTSMQVKLPPFSVVVLTLK